jgi:hypothetical protein
LILIFLASVTLSLRPESLILDTATNRGPIILFIAVDRGNYKDIYIEREGRERERERERERFDS